MKKIIYIFAIMLFALVSCDKEEVVQKNEEVLVTEFTDKNNLLRDYAKLLANSLNSNEIKEIIKNEALKKFDGDFNILATNLHKIQLKNSNKTFKNIISESLIGDTTKLKVKSQSTSSLDSVISRIVETFPNLQVSIPVHCDKWDTENYTPLVAFKPVDYDEKTSNEVIAYDINGNEFIISSKIDPIMPVIVVGISERVDSSGKLIGNEPTFTATFNPNKAIANTPSTISLKHGPSKSLVLEWEDVPNNGYEVWRMSNSTQFVLIANTDKNDNSFIDTNLTPSVKYWYKVRAKNDSGTTGWSPSITTTASERNDGEKLRMHSMKFTTAALRAVEDWISGAPELRLRVVKGSETGATFVFTSGQISPSNRDQIRDKWWHFEFDICFWHTNVVGTVLTFDWREEDTKYKYSFTVTGAYEDKKDNGTVKAGGSLTITNDPSPDNIGNTSVYWWHPRNQIYDITGFSWKFVN